MAQGGLKRLLKGTTAGRVLLLPYRFWYASKYFVRPWVRIFPWLVRSRELANFTYELTDLSKQTLCHFMSAATGESPKVIGSYVEELERDEALATHIRKRTREGPEAGVSDPEFRPAKRLAYYLLVRALKPKTVVEAGVDKGLGSLVVAAALLRNRSEGNDGRLLACDVSPSAGYLLGEPYTDVAQLWIGDARKIGEALSDTIDLFIQDTAPQLEHELLAAIEGRLSPGAVVCSVWHTGDLLRFAEARGMGFLVFRDQPKNHWYPGSELALAFPTALDG